MKKRLFLLPLLAVGMLCGCGEEEAGGGNSPTPPPVNPTDDPVGHTHSWSASWSHDETNHWKTCSGCSEKDGLAAHTFNGNICSVCGYEKQVTPPTPAGGLDLDFVTNFGEYKSAFPFVDASTGVYDFTLGGVSFKGLQCFVGSYSGSGYLMMKNKDMGGECAYIASTSEMSGSITKVEIVTGSSASTKATYKVVIGASAITSPSGAVTKDGTGASTTITATADASAGYKYFAIFTTNAAVNGQLASIKVTVA